MRILEELTDESRGSRVSSLDIALIYACLEEKDQAFQWLERSYQQGELAWRLREDPLWDPLRDA